MILRPCPNCGAPRHGNTCHCGWQRSTKPTSQGRTRAERQRRADTVAAWVATNGWVCPGWKRPPHPSHDLTADHTHGAATGQHGPLGVYCRPCNASKGGA